MNTLPLHRITVGELEALADAPRLARHAALLCASSFCTGAAARDGNGAPTIPLDSRARQFSIDGALERLRAQLGVSEEAETWVLRAYQELFRLPPCLDNDHQNRTACDALNHCAALLKEWAALSNA